MQTCLEHAREEIVSAFCWIAYLIGDIAPIYRFGEGVLEGKDLTLTDRAIRVPGFEHSIELSDDNPFDDMT